MTEPTATKGQIAYEAYAESLGWKSGVSGLPLPQWDDDKVTPQIKEGWEASAQAVIDSMLGACNGEPAEFTATTTYAIGYSDPETPPPAPAE